MFRRLGAALAVGAALLAGAAAAQTTASTEVVRAPTPAWVVAIPAVEAPPMDNAPIRVLAVEEQLRFDQDGVHQYTLRRIRVQTREGLGMVSTVSALWNPSRERLEVHAVRILRGDQVIDALEGQTFETLRRESNLENSMLDGQLTATLQPRDLRVGDIIESAFTIHDDGGVLSPHRETLTSVASGLTIDRYRLRASWPADLRMQAASTAPWSDVRARREGSDWVFDIQADGLPPQTLPQDIPTRFGILRTTQFTDYADWADASAAMVPLYEKGATLEADSPLTAEIERIRQAHSTDGARAMAALRLVQDHVRYVALSMGEGGYVPTAADEVWRRRYGDCKGKTVLLLALLDGLGIEAAPALVSTRAGDGLDERMPLIGWFDHVIVRAVVDGEVLWMDGTRTSDRTLADLTPPAWGWALPVQPQGAVLERLVQGPPTAPTMVATMEYDATQGLDAEGEFTVDMAYHGDLATQYRTAVSAIPPDQLQAIMESARDGEGEDTSITSMDTRYDEATNTFHMIMKGSERMSWVGAAGGRATAIAGTELTIPYSEERRGLYAAYKDQPYALSHPYRAQTITRIRLPAGGRGFRLEGADQVLEGGGYRMERTARLQDGVAEIVVTTTSLAAELSAAEMAEARRRAENMTSTAVRLRAPADYAATAGDRARLEPGSSDVDDLIERAGKLSDVGDAAGALALLDAAVARDAGNGKALLARAETRAADGDMAGARADYDAAVDLDPADTEALVGQGLTALRDGRPADAVVSFSVALRLAPDDLTALSGRAAAYHRIGRHDRALADARAMKAAAPDVAQGLYGELRALRELGREAEARTLIAERLTENPADATALDALAIMDRAAGRPAETLAALDAALAEAPDNGELLFLRAESRVAAGQSAGARDDYDALRGQAHGDPGLLNNLCWSQAVAGFDLDRALADCDRAIDAGEAAYIDSRARVLLQMGRLDEAKAEYDRALAEQPNQSSSLYGRGLARQGLGDADGQVDIDRALALDSDAAEDFESYPARAGGG